MAFCQHRHTRDALWAELVGVNMQKRRATGGHAIAKRVLNPGFLVQTMAVLDLDDQMGACEDDTVTADEVIIACRIEQIARCSGIVEQCIGGTNAVSVFRMGACLQTSPQLEEVGAGHGRSPFFPAE